jgi:hypothetical protein
VILIALAVARSKKMEREPPDIVLTPTRKAVKPVGKGVAESQTGFCRFCGARIAPGATFCRACGANLSE